MALPREELVLHRLQGVYMAPIYDLVKDRRVYSIDADRTVLEGARYMMEHNIGALPVLRNGELAGIFSERDIMNRVVAVGRLPGTTQISEVMTPNPTTKIHARPPSISTAAVIASGAAKLLVRSTTNPVRAGATTPAKFAKPFCRPAHRPAACGPARVCVNAKIPEPAIPQPTPAAISHGRYI